MEELRTGSKVRSGKLNGVGVMLCQSGEAGRARGRSSSAEAAEVHARCLILLQLLAAGSITKQPFQGGLRGWSCQWPSTGQGGPARDRGTHPSMPPVSLLCHCRQ